MVRKGLLGEKSCEGDDEWENLSYITTFLSMILQGPALCKAREASPPATGSP